MLPSFDLQLSRTRPIATTARMEVRRSGRGERICRAAREAPGGATEASAEGGHILPDSCSLNRRGQPINQSRLTKRLKGVLRYAGLPTAHCLYDLRHTYATIALA